MKISRSKSIMLISVLSLLIILPFIFNKEEDLSYVYSDNMIKEEIIDIDVSIVTEEIEPIVYDNMTLEGLSNKLELSLNDDLSGYGNYIASYSLAKGIDPYLATAIMLHETGCSWGCSSLVKRCHNVGGMKGSGCGEYGYFNSLEEGIQKFIDNIYNNYYAYGLTNANLMGNKYAEDPEWSRKVNTHIEKIKNR